MPPDGSVGQKAAADSFRGKSEIPRWLQNIESGKDPLNSPAKEIWLFQIHPFVPWEFFWQVCLKVCWVVAAICVLLLLWNNYSSLLPEKLRLLFHSLTVPILFEYLPIFILPALVVLYCVIKRRTVRHSKDPKKGFVLCVNLHDGYMTRCTEFEKRSMQRRCEERQTITRPSAIQNALPRLSNLQKIGRIKLRLVNSESEVYYIFEPYRFPFIDIIIMVIGFSLATVTFALSIYAFASQQASLLGIVWPSEADYAMPLFASLLGITPFLLGIVITWYTLKNLQQYLGAKYACIVIKASIEKANNVATLAWKQYLSILRGFNIVAVRLENADSLKELCENLSSLHERGSRFKLTQVEADPTMPSPSSEKQEITKPEKRF